MLGISRKKEKFATAWAIGTMKSFFFKEAANMN